MSKSFTAQIETWVTKVEGGLDAVVSTATTHMLADIEIVPGITRGGSRVKGTIPRDLGALAGSLQSSLYGHMALTPAAGEESYVLVAGSMKAGDVATFTWGGATAPYAMAVHYGANGVPGTFWVDVAANKWQGYVDDATRKVRAEIMG